MLIVTTPNKMDLLVIAHDRESEMRSEQGGKSVLSFESNPTTKVLVVENTFVIGV